MRIGIGPATKGLLGSAVIGIFLVLASCGEDQTTPPYNSGGGTSGTSGTTGTERPDSGDTSATNGASTEEATDSGTNNGGDTGAPTGPFTLTSSAFSAGATSPKKFVCTNGGGQNRSPPLAWSGAPAGTQSYAIVMRDLDYMNGFIHWAIWDIPGSATSLPENVQKSYQPNNVSGAKQAPFNANITGYQGPCSQMSVNTYELTLYAIPTATIKGLNQNSTKQQAAQAIVNAATANTKLAGES
jgi:Raf kinase inhibitor-like YbhB/YbcL family protein